MGISFFFCKQTHSYDLSELIWFFWTDLDPKNTWVIAQAALVCVRMDTKGTFPDLGRRMLAFKKYKTGVEH
jgi:hypothetical protein